MSMALAAGRVRATAKGLLVTDTFDGTNGTEVVDKTTTTGGLVWATATSPPGIGNTRTLQLDGAGAAKLSSDGGACARVTMPSGNVRFLFQFNPGSGGSAGSRIGALMFRMVGTNNYLFVRSLTLTGELSIRKNVAGVATVLATTSPGGITQDQFRTIEVTITGDDIVATRSGDGVSINHTLTGSDATTYHSGLGGVGVSMNDFSTSRIRYFEAQT